jgi:LysR family transcriptional regulator, glycine cleavage system transcriptional activator
MSKYRLPPLEPLKAFEAAARRQSIIKASEELHVTHQALSRRIQKLEAELGHRLFERHHRRIALTDGGKILFDGVSAAFANIHQAVVQLSGSQSPERLVISVDPDFAGLWLVPRLGEFYALVPDTLVEIRAERSLNASGNARIDCAIQYADAGLGPENGEILFRSRLFPVCSPHLARKRPLRSPADLRNHVLLHDRTITEWQQYLQSCSMTIGINVRLGFVFSETIHCLDAAARGQGVAIGDDFLAEVHLSEGRLVKPFGSSFLSKNAYYFVVPDGASPHPAVSTFRNWLLGSIDRLHDKLGIRRQVSD